MPTHREHHRQRGVSSRQGAETGGSRSRLVGLAVAAQTFGVSTKTLRRRIADGTVRGYRIGRLIRVDLDEVRAALVVTIASPRRSRGS